MKKLNAGRPLLAWATILTVLATAGSILSGCSLTPVEHNVIRVELPKSQVQALQAKRFQQLASTNVDILSVDPSPASRADFKCFAINVTGPGIAPDPKHQCTDPNEYVGILAGFVLINQEGATELSVTVPSGMDRRVQLIALTSADGTCGSVNNERDMANTGEPFIVGQTSVNLFGDTMVEIEATYDPATATPAFRSCGSEGGDKYTIPIAEIFTGERFGGNVNLGSAVSHSGPFALIDEFENWDALPDYSNSNSFIYSRTVIGAEMVDAAVQLRWDVTHLVDILSERPMMDLQLQLGASTSSCTVTPQFEVLEGDGLSSSVDLPADPGRRPKRLFGNGFYRNFAPHIVNVDGRKMIIMNLYGHVMGDGCTGEFAIAGARLRIPPRTSLPDLRMHIPDSDVFAGQNFNLSGYGGLPPYRFKSQKYGILSVNADGFWNYVVPSDIDFDTITMYDSENRSVTRTVGIKLLSMTGPSALLPGCNLTPVTLSASFPSGGDANLSGALSFELRNDSASRFVVSYYADSSCSTEISSASIAAGASVSSPVYIKVIASTGDLLSLGITLLNMPEVPLSHSATYSDSVCLAPGSLADFSIPNGNEVCGTMHKVQSFTVGSLQRLRSIVLDGMIKMESAPGAVSVQLYTDSGGEPGSGIGPLGSCTLGTAYNSPCTVSTLQSLGAGTYWISVSGSLGFCWKGSSSFMGGAKISSSGWINAGVSTFAVKVSGCGPF